jgi:long-chain acyl-CoA synthetase
VSSQSIDSVPDSLLSGLSRWTQNPDTWAIADGDVRVSWAELAELLRRATNAMLALKLQPEDRVAVLARNSVTTVITYLAALRAGVSSVPVNFHLTADELTHVLQDSNSKVLFVGPETLQTGKAAASLAGIPLIVGWNCVDSEVMSWDQWLGQGSSAEPPSQMRPRPYLHYTSGTTGRPKASETPPALFPQVATVKELFERFVTLASAEGRGPTLLIGPLYHTGPLTSIRRLAGGMRLVILQRFDAESVLRAIDHFRIESCVMVPTHFHRLLALQESIRAAYDVSSMKLLIHTGAACPIETKRRMIAWFGPVLLEGYGATEAGTTNAITTAEWLIKPGSVGKAQAPFHVLVIGADGERLAPGDVGLLYFRDQTGRGIVYRNDPQKTREAHLEPGVFTLGDVGYVDEDGYVYITDRASDMIISGGTNIYPAEIEAVLISHPLVDDVAVIGIPDEDMGEAVRALIVASTARPTSDELNQYCRSRLAGYKCPRSYEFVADVGRSVMGKLNKRALRAPYWPTQRTIA